MLGCISRNPRYAELRGKVGALASKATGDASLFVSYNNRHSSEGFNSNSLYNEAYHQMSMLQVKKQLQIFNGNNKFLRVN